MLKEKSKNSTIVSVGPLNDSRISHRVFEGKDNISSFEDSNNKE
jgi:hypothetical protein